MMGFPDAGAIEAIIHARHGDPFAVLGPHGAGRDRTVRAVMPGAEAVTVLDRGGQTLGSLQRLHPDGFWAGPAPGDGHYTLKASGSGGTWEQEDAYAFPPTLGNLDLYLLAEGRHLDLGHALGAHLSVMDGVPGVRFAVWAPNASRVSVVGDFNFWDARRHPMRRHFGAGVWDLFIPGVQAGAIYKYDLLGPNGETLPQKADPVAWQAEVPPATGSIVASKEEWRWTDAAWMARRGAAQALDAPISAYEVHAGSWLPAAEMGTSGWEALADRLAPYCAGMGFTHVELLPIMEHPFGGSWGYQPLGQYAPSSRLGSPEGFAHFVDRCHAMGVGVLLDWVPAHFPADAHGLALFDGTPLYEHADPREGFHPDWNTNIYNLGRNEVRGFLIANALFWLKQYHVDGLRVDAVASMLYRDYSRKAGEWVPNQYGGRENLESVAFLQDLSRTVKERCPGAVLIAEESTAWPGVTRSADEGGLGFHYKWNMGWMHDTLHYMHEDPINRSHHHGEITFGLVYAFTEHFTLPLSHDEVVYGKGSLIRRMPGDRWQKFANLRAYLSFMWTYPGKKLLFMGGEFAQDREWNHDAGLDWFLLDVPEHKGVQTLLHDLNAAYRGIPALHVGDCDPSGFRWVVVEDAGNSVFAYLRLGHGVPPVLVVCNFTSMPRRDYRVGVPAAGRWTEVLNSDAAQYGGSDVGNYGGVVADGEPAHGLPVSLTLTLPPLATLILSLD
ncbi:MAG: 1,4-alpha-glucan branching protein GlgB [Janthinobacterium lividum]